MTTPAYAELVAAVRREGESIVAAAGQGLDVAVPTCGDWTMRELILHVGRVYHRVIMIVADRATGPVAIPDDPGDVEPVEYLTEALDELVHTLSAATAETPAWNWSSQPQSAAFWARRMAHESAVHRFDAQRAHDVAQPIDADLAHDGIDELLDPILPRVVERDELTPPTGTYLFNATDDQAHWAVRLDGTTIERLDVAKEPDVTAEGTASALLLAGYGRVPWSSLRVDGDAALLDEWSAAFRF